jgi:hypothetical protein
VAAFGGIDAEVVNLAPCVLCAHRQDTCLIVASIQEFISSADAIWKGASWEDPLLGSKWLPHLSAAATEMKKGDFALSG